MELTHFTSEAIDSFRARLSPIVVNYDDSTFWGDEGFDVVTSANNGNWVSVFVYEDDDGWLNIELFSDEVVADAVERVVWEAWESAVVGIYGDGYDGGASQLDAPWAIRFCRYRHSPGRWITY